MCLTAAANGSITGVRVRKYDFYSKSTIFVGLQVFDLGLIINISLFLLAAVGVIEAGSGSLF